VVLSDRASHCLFWTIDDSSRTLVKRDSGSLCREKESRAFGLPKGREYRPPYSGETYQDRGVKYIAAGKI